MKNFLKFQKIFFLAFLDHIVAQKLGYTKKSHFLPLFTWFFATLRSLFSTEICYFFVIFHILRSNYAIWECASNSKHVLLPWATLQVTFTRFMCLRLDFKTFFSEKSIFCPNWPQYWIQDIEVNKGFEKLKNKIVFVCLLKGNESMRMNSQTQNPWDIKQSLKNWKFVLIVP